MIFQLRGIEDVIRKANALPKHTKEANKSALGSVGFHLIQELKKQIDSQGSHAGSRWTPQHPLTRLPKKRTGKQQRLTLRKNKPLRGLRKFTRYRVSNNAVQVLYARNKKGKVGSFDRLMNEFADRSEFGEMQPLTLKARRFRAARGFPVRKSTGKIKIPKRQTMTPVYRKNKRFIPILYRQKFTRSLQRKTENA